MDTCGSLVLVKSKRNKVLQPSSGKKAARRSADYTIQGFIYQFNKTLLEILNADDGQTITVEGIIEDIDIAGARDDTAIQCKYHESNIGFALSLIYKPLLQMLAHFNKCGGRKIRYRLYAYVKGQQPGLRKITTAEVQDALRTENKSLMVLAAELKDKVNIRRFLGAFSFEFGVPLSQLVSDVYGALESNGLAKSDIPTLLYPNAIQIIANRSMKHSGEERKLNRTELLNELSAIRATTISRWTLALTTRKMILEARRRQLRCNLSINTRLRYFILSKSSLEDFDSRIVTFISDYLEKYHCKPAHTQTPVFCLDCDASCFSGICQRLFQKGIKITDGCIGGKFFEDHFFRTPMTTGKMSNHIREFDVRLLQGAHAATLNLHKCNDLIMVGEKPHEALELQDVNVAQFGLSKWQELYFILGLSNAYE